LQTIKSATYKRLKLGNQMRHLRWETQSITLPMFVNNPNFKRESLDLNWCMMKELTAQDDVMVLRNLPQMRRVDLSWGTENRVTFMYAVIDSLTLLGLVEKIDNIHFGCHGINAPTLLQVFRVVCNSTQNRRIRIMVTADTFRILFAKLQSDVRYERKAEGWWRDRESGAVMFCGECFTYHQALTFMKNSMGYEDVDDGEF
ncbi:hypothetical protein PFISCL1PPCAC_8893, partial [Pristionchus fissidentatus]